MFERSESAREQREVPHKIDQQQRSQNTAMCGNRMSFTEVATHLPLPSTH